MSNTGWIGVDFDGTLAKYDKWVAPDHCGEPIAPMVERVKRWLAEGREVRIFTARVYPIVNVITPHTCMRKLDLDVALQREVDAHRAAEAIQNWCQEHLGQKLSITCVKDYSMIELWDDRAVQVRPNTGEVIGNSTRGL